MHVDLAFHPASQLEAKAVGLNNLDRCSFYVPNSAMGFDYGTLTFKALLVVHEATEHANNGTVPITVGLRFALAYLFATGQSKDANLFKNFAKCLADKQPAQIESFGNYLRSMQARGCRGAIMRNAGMEASPDNETKLREAFDRISGNPPANAPDGKPRL